MSARLRRRNCSIEVGRWRVVILCAGVVLVLAYAWVMAIMVLRLEDDFQSTTGAIAQAGVYLLHSTVWSLQRRAAAIAAAGRRTPAPRGARAAARVR